MSPKTSVCTLKSQKANFNYLYLKKNKSENICQIYSMKYDPLWKEVCGKKMRKTVTKNVRQKHFYIDFQILCIMGYGGNACFCG